MTIPNRFFPGTTLSRYLPPAERAWAGLVFEAGKPVRDCELVLAQDATNYMQGLLNQALVASGWLRGAGRSPGAFQTTRPGDPTFAENTFFMPKQVAVVAGFPVVVDYTETTTAGMNLIQLDAPPELGGTAPDVKRTDFVFLEVWLAPIAPSTRASNTVTVNSLPAPGDTIVVDGVTLTATAGAPGADQFLIGGSVTTTAANIASALNNTGNSFDTIASATTGGTAVVTLRAIDPGVAGNALTLSETGTGMAVGAPLFSGGVDMPNVPSPSTIYRNGNVLSPLGVALDDDLVDPVIGTESTQRVQVQYRIRVTGQAEAVNYQTQPNGFENTAILAQGAEAAPVATYPFLPAKGTGTSGNSSATAYAKIDAGLWIAGDGTLTAANALGTVDGYVYAIPLAMVFRRNDAYLAGAGVGFDPLANTNGALPSTHASFVNPAVGTIGVDLSDRPDNYYCDVIEATDLLDLRRHIAPQGFDWSSELQWQMDSLLDGRMAGWALDGGEKNVLGAGSGDVSTHFLVCNQIGRDSSHGGTAPTSGDTTRGPTIRNFDHVARRFGTAPVVERATFGILPGDDSTTYPGKYVIQTNVGYSGWYVGDEIHLDLSTLNASTLGDFDPATASYLVSANVQDFAPTGTTITDVLAIYHDDGNYTAAIDQTVQIRTVEGLGTPHVVITLDNNTRSATGGVAAATYPLVGSASDNGSPRRIFFEVEISYPSNAGLTDTPLPIPLAPDTAVYPVGAVLENSAAQRPADYEALLTPAMREGYREVKIEYMANDAAAAPVADQIVSRTATTLSLPRRFYGDGSTYLVTVTDTNGAVVKVVDDGATDYGSSTRLVTVDALSGAQALCDVTYYAQDPVPNYGAPGGGYQLGVYYRTQVKAATGTKSGTMALPSTLRVEPLLMSSALWTGQTGAGSPDLSWPYANPLEYLPVNEGSSTFTGEWYFEGTSEISVDNFDATVGLLTLPSFTPVATPTGNEFLLTTRARDAEFRGYYESIQFSSYKPLIMAQPLSGVTRHKAFFPFLARVSAESSLFRKNEIVLVVLSRWAELDADNTVLFPSPSNTNQASVAVFRTRDMLILAGE